MLERLEEELVKKESYKQERKTIVAIIKRMEKKEYPFSDSELIVAPFKSALFKRMHHITSKGWKDLTRLDEAVESNHATIVVARKCSTTPFGEQWYQDMIILRN